MIPKVIHYCWFSNEEKPELIKNCINSWYEKLSNYEIVEWTTDKFNPFIINYTRQAFESKKWAFVADYFRLWVLYNYGRIYLDCDVKVNKSFDSLLTKDFFIPWEDLNYVGPHIIGSVKGFNLLERLMHYYENIDFIINNTQNMVLMPQIITKEIRKLYKIRRNGKHQIISNNAHIYPMNFLTINVDDNNNICKHFYLGSWNNYGVNYYQVLLNHYNKYYSKFSGRIKFLILKILLKIKNLIKKSISN